MQKVKFKLIAILALFVLLCTGICYATDSTATDVNAVSVEEDANTTADNSVTEEGATTGESTTEEGTTEETTTEEPMIEEDYFYLSGNDLVLSDTIDSNAFIIGNNVTITSEIGGDLFVIANSLNLDGGYVYGNVFVLAKDFTLNATVYDIYAICSNITIKYDGIIYRDLRATANYLSMSGGVGRNCYISAQTLDLTDDALIYGDFNYSNKEAIVISEGVVSGNINYLGESSSFSGEVQDPVRTHIINCLATLVFTLAIYGLIIWLAPKFYSKMSSIKLSKVFIGLGIGIIALVIIPIISILLAFTFVGSKLTLAFLLIYFAMLSVSAAIAYISIGCFIANKFGNASKAKNLIFVLATALVFFLLGLIPFVGTWINLLVALTGFGVLILSIIKKKDAPSVATTVEE